jgi:hypothetical protein
MQYGVTFEVFFQIQGSINCKHITKVTHIFNHPSVVVCDKITHTILKRVLSCELFHVVFNFGYIKVTGVIVLFYFKEDRWSIITVIWTRFHGNEVGSLHFGTEKTVKWF